MRRVRRRGFEEIGWDAALDEAERLLRAARGRIVTALSGSETVEQAYALATLLRVGLDSHSAVLPEQVSDYKDRKPPRFALMSIGILQYHPTPILTDVWIDDVRVSSARIGCGAPPPM